MTKRRGTLTVTPPGESSSSPTTTSGPSMHQFPQQRATSPSFAQFLSKPSKWFNRSSSTSRVQNASEPRLSTSSLRKPKISHPSDPRPILENYSLAGSKSVLDVSLRPPNSSLDLNVPPSPSTPTSQSHGLGDLRSISKRSWSKSADDLGKITPAKITINTSMQERVAQYRQRTDSNASGLSPGSTPSSPMSLRQPFPTSSPISSSPPQTITHAAGVSISISAPNNDKLPQSSPGDYPTHVHSRSHSFTPRLPSKLSAPHHAPPTPQRKASGSSERDVEINPGRGSPNPSYSNNSNNYSSNRIAFPFNLGPVNIKNDISTATAAANAASRSSTNMLAPPAIIEPDVPSEEAGSKRSSQILYNSGFINRLFENPNHHLNWSMAKGWKPFKLELKGSKLYFYKPPGDRNTAIKELFPTEIVPSVEDEQQQHDVISGLDGTSSPDLGRDPRSKLSGAMVAGSVGRRKRAFWGRQTHPDLVKDDQGNVLAGTFEALVHEAIFATTFTGGEGGGVALMSGSGWKDFAATVVFSLPPPVGKDKFEAEFLRHGENLINGADTDRVPALKTRLAWLAAQYLSFHGDPADPLSWKSWTENNSLDVDSSKTLGLGLSASASVKGLFTRTPDLGTTDSPNLSMFSPRPEASPVKVAPLMNVVLDDGLPMSSPSSSANVIVDSPSTPPAPEPHSSHFSIRSPSSSVTQGLNKQLPHTPLSSSSSSSGPSLVPWSVIEKEGLSRDALLALDPQFISHSLTEFHKSCMAAAPDDIPAYLIQDRVEEEDALSPFRHLFGSDEAPHWLTKFILLQVLGSDKGSSGGGLSGSATVRSMELNLTAGPSTSVGPGPIPQPPSKTRSRSEIISLWARVGEKCRIGGDECSWRAIQAALCSRPIARLERVWKRVDPVAVGFVQHWVALPDDAEPESTTRVTVWGGDVKSRLSKQMVLAKGEREESCWQVGPLEEARRCVERFTNAFAASKPPVDDALPTNDLVRMTEFWRFKAKEGGGSGGYASKFVRIEQFNSLSLAAEPKRKGQFEPYFWTRTSCSMQTASPLIPLLFYEPLPSVSFINRSQLLRSRVDSSDHHEHTFMPHVEAYLQPKDHRPIRASAASHRRSLLDDLSLSQGNTLIPHDDGNLLLVVHPGGSFESRPVSRSSSRAPSRPPSSIIDMTTPERVVGRTPSIRVKPTSSAGLERRPSALRRSSLPSISQKPNLTFSETFSSPPLRVKVQAGTLNSLVNVLVHGLRHVSVSFADDNGETSLGGGKTRELYVEHYTFAKTWWDVFRTFVTPLVFFELLRKLYVTTLPPSVLPNSTDYIDILDRRIQVLETMQEWLSAGGGGQDILDDIALFDAFNAFLFSNTDHKVSGAEDHETDSVRHTWIRLQQALASLNSTFVSQSKRPNSRQSAKIKAQTGLNGFRMRSMSMREVPDVDQIDPEKLVDSFDGMIHATFSNVTEEDLLVAAEVLEVQTADRTAWFTQKDTSPSEDLLEVQTIHSHLHDLAPSPLFGEQMQDAIYRLLPPGIRTCFRAYSIMRKWIVSKVAETKIGLPTRQRRIEMFLKAIEVARRRSPDVVASISTAESPCIRTGVEAAITAALLSVESRAYQRAWQNVALARGTTCDALATLLQQPVVETTHSQEQLCVDMGWVLERLLEIISTPDVLDSPNRENHNLVNFDKRRNLCNFISNVALSASTLKGSQRDIVIRRGFERLTSAEREVNQIQFDLRAIKEDAGREHVFAPASPARKLTRPFQRAISAQVEKNKRDRAFRSRMQREKSAEQSRFEKQEEVVNKAMRPKQPNARQHRNKKSMSSLFGTFMRPLSTAFGAEVHTPGIKRSPSELDFTPSGKPSLVLNLVDARCTQFINTERSFTFQVDTEDGGHYLLQALNKKEMTRWMATIDKAAKTAAQRRLTYTGSPKPQVEDHMQRQSTSSRDPSAVFQVDLEALLQRETGSDNPPPGTIPMVIQQCLAEVERRGLTEVGIYRIAGMTSEVQALRDAFNRGEEWPIESTTDIHVVCDLVKSWFRVLPDPVLPSSSYHQVIEATKLENLDERLSKIREIVQGLPQANYDLLKRISEHLAKVEDHEEHNHMTAEALSIVFSPNLLRAPQSDFALVLANMGFTHKLVKALITHFNVIFDEEGYNDQDMEIDDDFEEPIVEEDEEEEEVGVAIVS